MKAIALSCVWMLLFYTCVSAQDTIMLVGKFSSRYSAKVADKATKVEQGLNKQSKKALKRLQKQQQKVYTALYQVDSNQAKLFLQNSQRKYASVISKLNDSAVASFSKVKTYIPGLDSMRGVLGSLNQLPGSNTVINNKKLSTALAATGKAGQALDNATEIKRLMREQEQQLKAFATRYKDLDITKQIKAYNKEVYYYAQRISEAKQTLNDPAKIEQQVLRLLHKNDVFRNWMQQNGQLSGLFGSPAGAGVTQNLAGLQTRQSVQQALQARIGTAQQVQQVMNTQLQAAQGQMNSMRSRLQQLGTGSVGSSSGDITLPDFKPNQQKTKSFLKRLEYGVNLQSTGKNRWLPATTDIGLSLGYKINDKSVVGLGAACKLGWGQPINHIRFSHQGVGLRSYVDYKLKGSLWLSGGYEQNYQSAFNNIAELQSGSAWKSSGLIGLSKKIKSGKKTMETKLLWDFLSYQQIPRTQSFLFRVEYHLH